VVRSLSENESTFRILAWEDFSSAYWKPLHAWLRLRGVPHETAENLVQGLFAKLHASPVAVGQLQPANGKLRSYLLTSLRNFWTDHLREAATARHAGSRLTDGENRNPFLAARE